MFFYSSHHHQQAAATTHSNSGPVINPFNLSDLQKIGIGMVFIGVLSNILGILLFFDRGFIAIGNIAFVFGIVLLIGHTKV